jgi:hypothetical protein
MHFFGSLKGRNNLFWDGNWSFGARVATHARRILAQRECSEAAQLYPVASGQPIANDVKDGIHDLFEIMSRQMPIMLGELSDQFGLDHDGGVLRCSVVQSEGCQSTE